MDIHKAYEKETGLKSYNGSLAMGDFAFTDNYIEWLEKKACNECNADTNHTIHISGPDDIIGPFTEIKALRKANQINKDWLEECKNDGFENTPLHVATVESLDNMEAK